LLYVLYYLAGLIAYLKFIQSERKFIYYVLAIFFFLFSLLCKGQAVTFSVALFLVDYYLRRPFTLKLWLEKIPFLLLSAIFGVVAVLAQHEIKALHLDIPYSLFDRLLFACNSFLAYIYKMVLPLNLVAFYPYPKAVGGYYTWIIYASPLILFALIATVIYFMRKGRVVAFGFAFFFINVILILQILAVGGAVMAERYTYLSYLGLFFIIGMGFQYIIDKPTLKNSTLKFLSVVCLVGFSVFFCVQTVARTRVWKGNVSLFTDMLNNYPDIPEANYSLGLEYEKQKNLDLALQYYSKAVEQFPTYKEALVHRFDMFRQTGQTDSAIADCSRLIKMDKNDPGPYANQGIAYCIAGKYDLAMEDFNKAIKLDSNNVKAIGNRGNLYDLKGKYDSALADYNRALKIDTGYYDAYGNRGRTYFHKGLLDEALKDLTLAIKYQPDNGENYALRSDVNNAKGNYKQALNDALTAQSKGKGINEGYLDMLKQKVNEVNK
jgi:Tfp pilus assembly protein PilF